MVMKPSPALLPARAAARRLQRIDPHRRFSTAGLLALVLATGACNPPSAPGDSRKQPSPGSDGHSAEHKGYGSRLFADLGRALTPGPAPPELSGARPDDCQACHPEIVREWRSSMHAQAWTDPIFQNEYRVAADPSCRGCHAPQNPAGRPTVKGAALDGISCAVCHIRAQSVIASPRPASARTPADALESAHSVLSTPLLARSEFCAPCHQFHFPEPQHSIDSTDSTAYDPTMWLQDTFGEWSRSDARVRGQPCQHCHMPLVQGSDGRRYRSHRFPGMRDRPLIESALQITGSARREGAQVLVRLHLQGTNIGHALPTGDMFRQLVIETFWPGRVQQAAEVVLRRSFAPVRRVAADGTIDYVHAERADTRVPPPGDNQGRTVLLRLPAGPENGPAPSAALTIHWRVTLWARERHSVLLSDVPEHLQRTVVAEGQLPVASPGVPDPAVSVPTKSP